MSTIVETLVVVPRLGTREDGDLLPSGSRLGDCQRCRSDVWIDLFAQQLADTGRPRLMICEACAARGLLWHDLEVEPLENIEEDTEKKTGGICPFIRNGRRGEIRIERNRESLAYLISSDPETIARIVSLLDDTE